MARNLDMFSFLPDSLILFIVSLLPYKDAARTSILSKQWLETWRNSKKIRVEFNEPLFENPGESNESKEAKRRAFLNSITHWISHNTNQFVDKFSLKVSDPQSCQEIIERCVAFATQRGVKELSLDFSDPNWRENNLNVPIPLMQLPQHVYDLGSLLESLKLYSCGFSMPDMLHFRSLKEISLGWIKFSETTLQSMLRNCKKLESLSLKKCGVSGSFDMGDEKIGLKRLVIDKCEFKYEYIVLSAPKLEFFKYSGKVWTSHIITQQEVMDEAEIDFPSEFEPTFFKDYNGELSTILGDFYPVRVLTICSFLLQVIPFAEDDLCKLNVRHLIVKTQLHPNELFGFTFVLDSCRWLEKLTLEISPRRIFHDYEPPYHANLAEFWERPMETARCLRKTLKVVEIKGCAGSLNEIKACRYLIGVGQALEEMNIHVIKDEKEKTRAGIMRKYLYGIPRVSPSKKLKLYIK